MSLAAARTARRSRKTCQFCRARRARYRYRGAVRADRHHTLCFACFRAARERLRARVLAGAPAPVDPAARSASRAAARDERLAVQGGFGPPRQLTASQIAHRQAMLRHLGG